MLNFKEKQIIQENESAKKNKKIELLSKEIKTLNSKNDKLSTDHLYLKTANLEHKKKAMDGQSQLKMKDKELEMLRQEIK